MKTTFYSIDLTASSSRLLAANQIPNSVLNYSEAWNNPTPLNCLEKRTNDQGVCLHFSNDSLITNINYLEC